MDLGSRAIICFSTPEIYTTQSRLLALRMVTFQTANR